MNTAALIMMVVVQFSVTLLTIYFFRKVLKSPPKKEPDSYSENDNVLR